MNTKTKKGFTLTELIIVVVIIGILAAVLIPTLTACVKKAKISNDKQLVRNLNLALANDEEYVISGEKHENMQKALDAAFEAGYDVSKINATKYDNEILWDSLNDVFCYLNGDDIEYIPNSITGEGLSKNDYRLWKISDVIDANYSTYYTGSETTINTSKGFDAGTNQNITAVNYTHSGDEQKVIIRTNGGTLTVNALADTVKHYGDADSVNIVAVASASYHENGTVPFIQISKGRIEIEATGDVNGIHVANIQTVDSEGNISKTANTFTGDVVLTLNGNDVKLTRDTIGTEISSAVLVCAVDESASSATEYIWLVGDGTIENAKVYVTASNDAPNTSVASTTTTANASAAAVAIANNAVNTGTSESPVYTAQEAGTSAAEAEVASALKGIGTEDNPFLVYDYATMQKISDFYNKGYFYFAVDMSKTKNGKIDCTGWSPLYLNGSFNGNGVIFINLDNELFERVNVGSQLCKLSNFDAEVSSSHIYGTHDSPILRRAYSSITFENVNVSGTAIGYGIASYIGLIYSDGTLQFTFNNCVSSLNISGYGEYAAGFIGYSNLGASFNGNGPIGLELNESYFVGTLMSAANYYYSWGNNTGWFTNFADNSNNKTQYVSSTWNGNSKQLIGGTYLVESRNLSTKSGAVGSIEVGSTLSVEASAGSTICDILTFVSPNDTNESGSYTGLYYKETVSLTDGQFISVLTKKWNITINGDATTSTGLNGNIFNIINEFYGHTHNGYTVYFVEYSNESRTTVTSVTAFSFGKSN